MGTDVPAHDVAYGLVPFDATSFNFDEGIVGIGSSSTDSGSNLEDDGISVLSEPNDDFENAHQIGPYFNLDTPSVDKTDDERPSNDFKQDDVLVNDIPKIPKNDLRRSFAKMFISAVNLGDFEKMQEFSHTFIRPNAPFSSRLFLSQEYQIPPVLHCVGPRSHVHYMLGCYVMFPDLVLGMGNSQIVTSNHWPGSKILIPFECKMTKTYHIPPECWVPAEESAEKLYAEPSIERMMAALSVEDAPQDPAQSSSTEAQDQLLKKLNLSVCPKVDVPVVKKRKRARKSKSTTTAPNNDTSQLVPVSFADALRRDATMILCPQVMHFQGLYTLSLDETHHIQRIDLIVHPLGAAT